MNRVLTIMSIIASLSLSSCDGFRTLAGRPTKAEIEAIRAQVAEQQEIQEEVDGLAVEETVDVYVMTAKDSAALSRESVIKYSALGSLADSQMSAKYYVIIGSFKQVSNAFVLMNTVKEKGYEPVIVDFKNGIVSVGVCKTDNAADLLATLKTLKAQPFCPKDVWILTNE